MWTPQTTFDARTGSAAARRLIAVFGLLLWRDPPNARLQSPLDALVSRRCVRGAFWALSRAEASTVRTSSDEFADQRGHLPGRLDLGEMAGVDMDRRCARRTLDDDAAVFGEGR